ncbi:SMC-Scp complex subunit ScpB [Lysobacter pythonis]|uniref:SMC-Scp complex subunit ScpB n=1 Tax=Solilutibacter pythonis TaxID=2483112 RepID=A0A3M2I7W3_9GAMM|nr:SMC-Scp complex subunit ScpB [Lysobacter pythonis]RMH94577.1 SMC-Scp complex subunit ScpB [Lysobacter pythonis]
MEQSLINRIVEAALLASGMPLTLTQLAALFTVDEPPPEGGLQTALAELRNACEERGMELVEVASGWRYQVKSDVHPWVSRLWAERQTKYTRATLETLALIAYRQPITRGEIEQIRGVATNSNIIKALEERDWIRSVGHRDVPGRPELLGTTKTFLDYFGLKKLDELPPLSELKDFGELDPQFNFNDAPIAAGANADMAAEPPGAANTRDEPPLPEHPAGDGEETETAPASADDRQAANAAAPTPDDAAEAASPPSSPPEHEEHDIAADGEVRSMQ